MRSIVNNSLCCFIQQRHIAGPLLKVNTAWNESLYNSVSKRVSWLAQLVIDLFVEHQWSAVCCLLIFWFSAHSSHHGISILAESEKLIKRALRMTSIHFQEYIGISLNGVLGLIILHQCLTGISVRVTAIRNHAFTASLMFFVCHK